MKYYNLKFEKTKSGNLINDLFYVDFVCITGLNVVRVEPLCYSLRNHFPLHSCSFYFKDLTSALNFCSRFHVPHELNFWVKRQHHLMSYEFWSHFASSMTYHSKRLLNSLNHE